MKTVGSRVQVWNGNAKKTSGGLTKKDLIKKKGRIRSRRASRSAKKNQNLKNAGWTFKKGEFGAVRIEDKKKGSNIKIIPIQKPASNILLFPLSKFFKIKIFLNNSNDKAQIITIFKFKKEALKLPRRQTKIKKV